MTTRMTRPQMERLIQRVSKAIMDGKDLTGQPLVGDQKEAYRQILAELKTKLANMQ